MRKIVATWIIGMLVVLTGVWLFLQHVNGARIVMAAGMVLEIIAVIRFIRHLAQAIPGRIIITGLIGMLVVLAGVWLFLQHVDGARIVMAAGMALEIIAVIRFIRHLAQATSRGRLL